VPRGIIQLGIWKSCEESIAPPNPLSFGSSFVQSELFIKNTLSKLVNFDYKKNTTQFLFSFGSSFVQSELFIKNTLSK
jgi:hypothetical protein